MSAMRNTTKRAAPAWRDNDNTEHDDEPIPQLLTVAAVAQLFSVSARQVRRLIACGELPCVRIGERGIRIPERDVATFVRHRTETRGKTAEDYRRPEAWN